MLSTDPFEDDKLHDECGVFGIFDHDDAAAHTALGLHALQHRGQEAAGIVTFDGEHFHTHRAKGQVGDNFNSRAIIDACRPFDWKDDFPPVAESSPELRDKTLRKWGHLLD